MLKKSQVLNEGYTKALNEAFDLIYEKLFLLESESLIQMITEDTYHWTNSRKMKCLLLFNILGKRNVECVYRIFIDKGHRNGTEIHECFSNGCVVVYNQHTLDAVTAMAKTPEEFRNYERQRGSQVFHVEDGRKKVVYDKYNVPNGTYHFKGEIMKNAQRAKDLGLNGWHPGDNWKRD